MTLWRSIKIAGSLAVMAGLLWWVGLQDVLAHLQDLKAGWLVISFLALTGATLSMAYRWQRIAKIMGMSLSFGHATKEYYIAQLLNSTLPGGVVGDVGRAVRARHLATLMEAGKSVLVERLLGQIFMLAILGAGLTASLCVGTILWPAFLPWLLGACEVFCLLGVFIMSRLINDRPFIRVLRASLKQPVILFHTLFAAILLIISLYACARATGTALSLEASATILPMVFCAMLVPLSVAGWGWREGAASLLFPFIGAPASAGIAMGVTYGALMLLATLPALGLLWMTPKNTGQTERRVLS